MILVFTKLRKSSDYDFTIFRKSRNLSVAKYGHFKFERLLKVFKAWVGGLFQGKMFMHNISGHKDVIETKFGTWTDFTVLNIFKGQWHFVWSRDMSRDTFPENFTYLKNCQRIWQETSNKTAFQM